MKVLDFILVHGHTLTQEGRLDQYAMIPRLDWVLELFKKGEGKFIIVAGKHCAPRHFPGDIDFVKRTGITEAKRMKEYLEAKGVSGNKILEENDGCSTWDCTLNAYSKIIAPNGWKSGHIVSSREHLARVAWMTDRIMGTNLELCFSGPIVNNLKERIRWLKKEVVGLTYCMAHSDESLPNISGDKK